MSQETGKVATATKSASGTSGTINRDLPLPVGTPTNINPIPYNNSPIDLKQNDAVKYDIVDTTGLGDYEAQNISLISTPPPVDPDFPVDSNYPGATIITSSQNGNLIINGNTVIVEGATITGNAIVQGGTLILKSAAQDGTVRAKITGDIEAKQDATVIIYKSDVGGDLHYHNNSGSSQLKIKGGSSGGDTNVHNSQKVIHGSTMGGDTSKVGGDVSYKDNNNVIIDGLIITGMKKDLTVKNTVQSTSVKNTVVQNGDVEITKNAGCSYSNISTPNGSQNISGCTLV